MPWDSAPPASTMTHKLAGKIEHVLGLDAGFFNVVLVNRYKSGADFMEWHSDNERNMGSEPVIASVSVGCEREFLIRPRREGMKGKPVDVVRYRLKHGSLLVMMGKMQRFYQHAVPKCVLDEGAGDCHDGVRLNFTFRRVIDEKEMSCYPTEG